jgi:hypothetical protein
VCFLFGDAETRKQVNNCLGLDLKLAGQFVDSDLIDICHALLRIRFFLLFRTNVFRAIFSFL